MPVPGSGVVPAHDCHTQSCADHKRDDRGCNVRGSRFLFFRRAHGFVPFSWLGLHVPFCFSGTRLGSASPAVVRSFVDTPMAHRRGVPGLSAAGGAFLSLTPFVPRRLARFRGVRSRVVRTGLRMDGGVVPGRGLVCWCPFHASTLPLRESMSNEDCIRYDAREIAYPAVSTALLRDRRSLEARRRP